MIEIEILKKIRRQLAHIMAWYGDQPEELMQRLELLVIEWFEKGIVISTTG
jgi:predicted class III extradiol MEMO1 family dioxygenase